MNRTSLSIILCVLFISDIEDSGSNVHIKTTVTAGQHVPPVAILKRKHIETETNLTLCLFSQAFSSDPLRIGTKEGKSRVSDVATDRQKFGDEQYTDTLDRLTYISDADWNSSCIMWHKSCYSRFTARNLVDRLRNKALCHHGEQTSDILHDSPSTYHIGKTVTQFSFFM